MREEHQVSPSPTPQNNPTLNPATPPPAELIKLTTLPKFIPPARGGKRRNKATVYRYALKGSRGVRLETWRLPDGLYTSLAAWDRFVEHLTKTSGYRPPTAPQAPTPGHTRRQREVEAEIEAVRASFRKKHTSPKEDAESSRRR